MPVEVETSKRGQTNLNAKIGNQTGGKIPKSAKFSKDNKAVNKLG